jgi:hypothetical protein
MIDYYGRPVVGVELSLSGLAILSRNNDRDRNRGDSGRDREIGERERERGDGREQRNGEYH